MTGSIVLRCRGQHVECVGDLIGTKEFHVNFENPANDGVYTGRRRDGSPFTNWVQVVETAAIHVTEPILRIEAIK